MKSMNTSQKVNLNTSTPQQDLEKQTPPKKPRRESEQRVIECSHQLFLCSIIWIFQKLEMTEHKKIEP